MSLEPGFVIKSMKNEVYAIGVGLFGHILGVCWELGFVAKPCKNTVFLVGVGLFGLILPFLALVPEVDKISSISSDLSIF